jgi:outer membrane biogenesis lipoprotein LolB
VKAKFLPSILRIEKSDKSGAAEQQQACKSISRELVGFDLPLSVLEF